MIESKDKLGDRLKELEQAEAGRKAVKGFPLMARLDGRAFHTFTRGLARPYDVRLSDLMTDTTKFLVENTHAMVGYTQSDEISLCWFEEADSVGQYLFDGKFQKLTSVLSSLATTYFAKNLAARLPEKADVYPTFDCRVWQVPTIQDAYLNFLWRQDDAVKNSISMAAQAEFSHKVLDKVNSLEKKAMLEAAGKSWDDHPEFFKSGTFVKRVVKSVELSSEQLAEIPEKHRPTGPVLRTFVEDVHLGLLRAYKLPAQELF